MNDVLYHQPSADDGPRSSVGGRPSVVIIGAGLAGSEAAWQAAQRGVHVVLYEMRPQRTTPAHQTGDMAELVCSNSLGSSLPDRALGLLKDELRRLGSLIIACADENAVPAGNALAVDREAFSRAVTAAIVGHPNIEVRREEITTLNPVQGSAIPLIVATGPLTSLAFAETLRELAGQDHLAFFDAMAPIVAADSIDMSVAWRGNRYSKSADQQIGESANQRIGEATGEQLIGQLRSVDEPIGGQPSAVSRQPAAVGDYINCPLNRDEYFAFVEAIKTAEKIDLREFEEEETARRYFEACLPIEVLAARDPKALAYGPMMPLGLRDPRTGRRPYAVVQLRQDNAAGSLYNLVGFQTHLRWGEQERVLRMIPGLERAEFVRLGQMHRNIFINSPALLRPTLQWHDRDDLLFAGQITGTEGYVGSTASGLWAGVNAARVAAGLLPAVLPPTTMAGALIHYVTHADAKSFQPMKANFGLMPELGVRPRDKRERYAAYAARALADLQTCLASIS